MAETTKTMEVDESIDNLSRSTQSLLLAMRLDVVLLTSQQDESRSILSNLEKDWAMLQKMLEEQAKEERVQEEKNNKEKEQKVSDGNEKQRPLRLLSSVEWSADGSNREGIEQGKSQQEQTRTLNLSDYSNQNSSKDSKQGGLDRSNFDWGAAYEDGDDVHEEDRKANNSAPITLDNMLREATQNETGSVDDDLPPIKRIFGWGRDRRDSKISINSTDASVSSSLFGRKGPKKQEGDDAASTLTEGTAGNRNIWQAMFRRDGDKKKVKEEKEDVQSTPTSIQTSSAEKELSDAISTMQVKLRGFDSAASSLQQLLSYQKRQITDLQNERNQLRIISEVESQLSQSELKSLRTQAESVRLERERKISQLKEAENCKSKLVEKEEKLKEELECVRMELLMLKEEQNQKKVVFVDGS